MADRALQSERPHLALVTANAVRRGGIPKFSRFLIESLLESGWRVTMALSGDDICADLAARFPRTLKVDRVDWVDETLGGDRPYRWSLIRRSRDWFREAGADVALFIQSTNTPFRASVVGAWLAGVPIVTTHRTMPYTRDLVPSRRYMGGLVRGPGLYRGMVILKTWLTVALARRIVYNNHAVGRAYEQCYRFPKERGRVIPNAVDAPPVGLCSSDSSAQPESNDRAITIGYVGRLAHEKRLDILLHAVAGLPAPDRVKVLLCGEGPDRERLVKLADELRLTDRVEWHEAVDDVWPVYRHIDVVVLCSPRESSSNMILEAMACGRAVVVTDAGGLPELIDHGRCGMCVPALDVPALTRALVHLIEDPHDRHRLAVSAMEKACRAHAPAATAAAWRTVLAEAAGLRGMHPADQTTGSFKLDRIGKEVLHG